MKKLGVLLFLLPLFATGQITLRVSVLGVATSKGNISVAVYNHQDGFLKFDKVFKSDSILAKQGTTEIAITDLPEGEYALAIFHDENANNVLDVNWLGIPKEKFAFSKGRMKTFGPPSYKECAFSVTKDQTVQIVL